MNDPTGLTAYLRSIEMDGKFTIPQLNRIVEKAGDLDAVEFRHWLCNGCPFRNGLDMGQADSIHKLLNA